MHNFEPNTDCFFENYQTHRRLNLMHEPANVTLTFSMFTSCGGKALESYYRSPFSVVAALVPPAQQMAKRSHPFTDEASKYQGASSKSKPVGKRVLALAAVRHGQSSPLI